MYLRCHARRKDGKEHRYWSIEEKRRCADGRAVDRRVLYLGELNDSQQASWLRCIEAFEEGTHRQLRLALFPADRAIPAHAADIGVQVRLSDFRLARPRQWGACWVACPLWPQLPLDQFWRERLPPSREGTAWDQVLLLLVAYRFLAPGASGASTASGSSIARWGDLLGADLGAVAKDTLYRCLDKLLAHKADLCTFLTRRWQDLFGATYDLLLYDLTRPTSRATRPTTPPTRAATATAATTGRTASRSCSPS